MKYFLEPRDEEEVCGSEPNLVWSERADMYQSVN